MRYYSHDKLMEVVKDRGYMTDKAVADALVPYFDATPRAIRTRLRSGKLTKEECEVIGSYFRMTMKEYYDTFMGGLFVEDQEGHYVCKVDEPYLHLHPNVGRKTMTTKSHKAMKTAEILAEIDRMK